MVVIDWPGESQLAYLSCRKRDIASKAEALSIE
jgi:hypothetical protein